jgi:chromosomal replication initiator protein
VPVGAGAPLQYRQRDYREEPRLLARQEHLHQAWVNIQSRLRSTFPNSTYQIWLAGLTPVALDGRVLYVRAPADTRDWVSRRFGATLNRAAVAAYPPLERVQLMEAADQPPEKALPGSAGTIETLRPGQAVFKPAYTFNRFVIGNGNRFAHAAALVVAEMPGQAYNPLLLHGPIGVGKTHLLQAIGNYVSLHDASLSVHYATAETFTSEFISALQHSGTSAFKDRYRSHDVFLLDDIQILDGKAKTAEEVLHTLEALSGTGAQIVAASDRHPYELSTVEPRLRERLGAGLVVDLHPPDVSTRHAILKKLAATSQLPIEPAVLAYLAEHVSPNIRALEGALVRTVAFASLTESNVSIDVAAQVLTSLQKEHPKTEIRKVPTRPSVSRMQHETAAALGLEAEALCSSSRRRQVVYARQVAMYLCRELTDLSLPAIAHEFGGRDHTAVLHGHRKIKARLLTDVGARSLVTTLTQAVHSPKGGSAQPG